MTAEKRARFSFALAFGGLFVALIGQVYLQSLAGLNRHAVEVAGRPFRTTVLLMELGGVIAGAKARDSDAGRAAMITSLVLLLVLLLLNWANLLVFERF